MKYRWRLVLAIAAPLSVPAAAIVYGIVLILEDSGGADFVPSERDTGIIIIFFTALILVPAALAIVLRLLTWVDRAKDAPGRTP